MGKGRAWFRERKPPDATRSPSFGLLRIRGAGFESGCLMSAWIAGHAASNIAYNVTLDNKIRRIGVSEAVQANHPCAACQIPDDLMC
jgi:hypothetical protein